MRKRSKKIIFGISTFIVITIIILFALGILQTMFYGIDQISCSFGSDYVSGNLACSTTNANTMWGNEQTKLSPEDIIPFKISYNSLQGLYKTSEFQGFQNVIVRDIPESSDFFKNSICMSRYDWIRYNSNNLNDKCSSFTICDSGNNQGIVSCTCSLVNEYEQKYTNALGIIEEGSQWDGCTGWTQVYFPDSPMVRTYRIQVNDLLKNKFPNQLIIVEGRISEVRDDFNHSISFKTYGYCDLGTGNCNIHAPSVDLTNFPRSHAYIDSMKIVLKVGGYNTNSTPCTENGIESCDANKHLLVCNNYNFQDNGLTDGKCGYVLNTTIVNNDNNNTCMIAGTCGNDIVIDNTTTKNKNILAYIAFILVIITFIFFTYALIKRRKKY